MLILAFLVNIVIRAVDSKTTWGHQLNKMPNHCIQLTADQRAFNVFSVSFCEVICNQRHQAAATDAG